MAVPTTVKIPEPITAPMPSDVRLSQPSDFLSCFSGCSESEMSWSIFFLRKSCGSNRHLPRERARNSTLREAAVQPSAGATGFVIAPVHGPTQRATASDIILQQSGFVLTCLCRKRTICETGPHASCRLA